MPLSLYFFVVLLYLFFLLFLLTPNFFLLFRFTEEINTGMTTTFSYLLNMVIIRIIIILYIHVFFMLTNNIGFLEQYFELNNIFFEYRLSTDFFLVKILKFSSQRQIYHRLDPIQTKVP